MAPIVAVEACWTGRRALSSNGDIFGETMSCRTGESFGVAGSEMLLMAAGGLRRIEPNKLRFGFSGSGGVATGVGSSTRPFGVGALSSGREMCEVTAPIPDWSPGNGASLEFETG